jgi:hypothetical protein
MAAKGDTIEVLEDNLGEPDVKVWGVEVSCAALVSSI